MEIENNELKKRVLKLEEEKQSLKSALFESQAHGAEGNEKSGDPSEVFQLKEINAQLSRRVEYLQKREKELLQNMMKYQKDAKRPVVV